MGLNVVLGCAAASMSVGDAANENERGECGGSVLVDVEVGLMSEHPHDSLPPQLFVFWLHPRST